VHDQGSLVGPVDARLQISVSSGRINELAVCHICVQWRSRTQVRDIESTWFHCHMRHVAQTHYKNFTSEWINRKYNKCT